ncbi:MAG: hypothetical protein METHP_00510 [Methanoregula sp. SKADARSKE-2]|nr:MAG: hypothetical protein METHP_00510 [Methanoregula sp. SKADARSKE-2]
MDQLFWRGDDKIFRHPLQFLTKRADQKTGDFISPNFIMASAYYLIKRGTIDGKSYHIDNLAAEVIPEFALNEKAQENPDRGTALFAGAVLTQELQYIGHTIINVTVPVAVAIPCLEKMQNLHQNVRKPGRTTRRRFHDTVTGHLMLHGSPKRSLPALTIPPP